MRRRRVRRARSCAGRGCTPATSWNGGGPGTAARWRAWTGLAAGVDVLGDRWTPLIIRELMVGAGGFNEIHRGLPRISRSLLAQRLRDLERRGLVKRTAGQPGRSGAYELSPAGQALTPIVWAMGHWAAEWIFGDPGEDDC